MSDIERRIAKLEKASRYWRGATLVLVVLFLTFLIGAASPSGRIPAVLKAKRIELIGSNGKPVIIMGSQGRGSALSMIEYGSKRRRAIGLSVDENAARLILMKHSDAPLLIAQVDNTGSSITLSDGREPSEHPKSVVMRSVYASGNVAGGTGITLMKGPYKKDVEASLSIEDWPQGPALLLGGTEGKAARLLVNQESGKVEFQSREGAPIWATP